MPDHCLSTGFLVAAALLSSLGAPAEEGDTCEVGLVKQIFLDDIVVDDISGCRKVLNQPQRHAGNPILEPARPWEGRSLQAPIVLWDAERGSFRMYYWAHYDQDDRIFTCYAESEDGVVWERPVLGLYEGPDGTKDNNIVLRGEGRQARMRYVSLNPYAEGPEQRYVTMYIDNVPGLTEFIAYSPDGLHWTTAMKIGDLRGVTGGPPTPNPRFFLVEQKWDTSKVDHRYRAIWRTESQDLKTWGGGTWAVQLAPEDDRDLEFYHATSHFLDSHTYHGLHLGYIYPYHTDPGGEKLGDGTRMAGTIDNELIASRDTIQWERVAPRTPFFTCGHEGSWDAGMAFVAPETVVGDELRFYYGGWALEHSADDNHGAIGLARLRLDGFVHFEAVQGEGTVTTKPFVLSGSTLLLNADGRGGSIRVAVLDANGGALGGFGEDDCRPITADGLRQSVVWGNHRELAGLTGRLVRLRFHLGGTAKLYAFQFMAP